MTHHGRGKGNGGKAFGDRHDDRNFDVTQAKNIDPELTPDNLVWHYYMDEPPKPEKDASADKSPVGSLVAPLSWRIQGMVDQALGTDYAKQDKERHFAKKRSEEQLPQEPTVEISKDMTFDQVETRFYEDHFSEQLQKTNARYRAGGHPERCKDMATWKQSRRNAPAESVYQIGDKHTTGVYVDAETLRACYDEFAREEQQWNEEHGNPFTILNRALHVDEPDCPPHIHVRRAWHYKAADGTLRLGQEKALAQAGIELPDPDKKEGRFNNRKMVYDAMMREKWLDVLERHGVQVEREPVPGSKGKPSKDKEKYIQDKYDAMMREAEAAKAEVRKVSQELADAKAEAEKLHQDLADTRAEIEGLRFEKDAAVREYDAVQDLLAQQQQAYDRNQETLDLQEESMAAAESWMNQIPDWPSYDAEATRAFNLLESFRKALQDFFSRPWPWRDRKGERGLLEAVETLRDRILTAVSAMKGYEVREQVAPELQRSRVIVASLDEMTRDAAARVAQQKRLPGKRREIEAEK